MNRRIWPRLFLPLLLVCSHAHADADLSGRTLSFESDNKIVWQHRIPPSMGPLVGPLTSGENTYLGVGPAVYAFGPRGEVLGRADLPGVVASLDSGGGAVRVSTQGEGYTENFTLGAPENNLSLPVIERVVMPPDPAITGWLARVADSVPAPQVQHLAREFPSNPFLALREAEWLGKSDRYGALSAVRRALGGTLPFSAWIQLAARLDRAGFSTAADLALEHAKKDAAARGLDPEIPISRAALAAYGNPSAYAGMLLAQGKLERAGVWMDFLRELYPNFEGHSVLYARYAAALEGQGRVGEAEEWRQFDRDLREGSLYNLGPNATQSVRNVARLGAAALLLSLLAAYLTLGARAWKAQGEDTRPLGGRWRSLWLHPLRRARLTTLSYASFAERLMMALLALALLVALGGWQWANQTGQGLRAAALNMGTYGGGWYSAHLDDLNLRPGPDTALLAGLAAQLDGDDETARDSYDAAGQDACALNNLGVLAAVRGDKPQALDSYRSALSLRPDLGAAAYNLGLNQHTPGATFQHTYRAGQPRLCYPDQRILARAVSGDLSVTLRRDLLQPLAFLTGPQEGRRMGWVMLAALALLSGLLLLLLIPSAVGQSTGRRLGRPALFRLLALLFPGSSLLGNAWGGVLLVAWAAALIACLPLTGLGRVLPLPGLPPALPWSGWRLWLLLALVLTYGLNILAFSLAEARAFAARRQERAGK